MTHHLVVLTELRGSDIRPPALLEKFRQQSLADAATYFPSDRRVTIPCPGCGSTSTAVAFHRGAFSYDECVQCRSVFVKNRPHADDLQRYYSSSRASRLRIEYFVDETARARSQHIIQSRVDWIDQVLARVGEGRSLRLVDLGTLYPGLFPELRTLKAVAHVHSAGADPEVRRKLGSEVNASSPEPGSADAVTAFEQLEHQADPRRYIADIRALLRPGGHLFLTTRTISGFDLQILWEKAPYIFVPEHLNLLSVEGLSQLVQGSGLELVELSTPGQLDVALVRETLDADAGIRIPRFADYLLRRRGDEAHEDLQAYLQKHRLSSHVRIVARR